MAIDVIMLLSGFILLVLGAEILIRGATSIANNFKIPEYAIGATLVAFGTSTPELATSTYASYIGQSDISISNVIGSNLFNIVLIIGLTSFINPIKLKRHIFEKDATHFIFSAIALLIISINFVISRLEGLILVALLAVYASWLLRQKEEFEADGQETVTSTPLSILYIFVGLLFLIFGSRLTVSGAVKMAQMLSVTPWIIGVLVISAGTGLPELFTSVVAALKKKPEIAIGNVIGSNIFNVYSVLGFSAIVNNLEVKRVALLFDIPINFALSLGLLFMIYDRTITRENGLTMLLIYGLIVLTIIQIH